MSTSVSSVTNHFPSAENGFTTTTSGAVSSGASTVGLNSVAGYTNGEVVVFIIDPSDATKKQAFTGIIDTAGVQVTNVVWTAGTNQSHDAGATVVDYYSATHISMITKGILVEHNQDGTHDEALITSRTAETTTTTSDLALIADASASNALKKVTLDNLVPDSAIVTAKVADAAVTPAKLLAGTGTTWVWQTWTPTFVNLSGGTLNYSKYIQIGKTVHFRLKYTLAGANISGAVTFTTPTSIISGLDSSDTFIEGVTTYLDTGTAVRAGSLRGNSSTAVEFVADNGSTVMVSLSSTVPHTWANTDVLAASGTYEAA